MPSMRHASVPEHHDPQHKLRRRQHRDDHSRPAELPAENITVENANITAKQGGAIIDARFITLRNVHICRRRPAFQIQNGMTSPGQFRRVAGDVEVNRGQSVAAREGAADSLIYESCAMSALDRHSKIYRTHGRQALGRFCPKGTGNKRRSLVDNFASRIKAGPGRAGTCFTHWPKKSAAAGILAERVFRPTREPRTIAPPPPRAQLCQATDQRFVEIIRNGDVQRHNNNYPNIAS